MQHSELSSSALFRVSHPSHIRNVWRMKLLRGSDDEAEAEDTDALLFCQFESRE